MHLIGAVFSLFFDYLPSSDGAAVGRDAEGRQEYCCRD